MSEKSRGMSKRFPYWEFVGYSVMYVLPPAPLICKDSSGNGPMDCWWSAPMARKVLSVCYERCLPDSTLEFLERAGCQMTCARAVGTALQLFATVEFNLILINQTVSGPQEHLFVKLVRERSEIPVVFVSGDAAATATGVNVWLKPPVTPEELLQVISELIPAE